MKSLPKQERVRALQALGIWCQMELTGAVSPGILERLGFGSIEAMRIQLENWGLPSDWFTEQKGRKPTAKKGGSNKSALPPVGAAYPLFEAGIERLQKVLKRLPLRKDYRQDGLLVSELSVPWLEPVEQEAGYSPIVAPPDAEPNEDGSVEFTLAEAHRLEFAGAGRYPDEEIAALIGSTILSGKSADEMLDALRPGADDKVRDKVCRLIEGKDGLKARARHIASIMRGGTSGQGQRVEESFSPEEQAAARYIAHQRRGGMSDSEILEKLRSSPKLLRKTKERREITIHDVERLGSLKL